MRSAEKRASATEKILRASDIERDQEQKRSRAEEIKRDKEEIKSDRQRSGSRE